jgi:PAS domain S-box-containing protein
VFRQSSPPRPRGRAKGTGPSGLDQAVARAADGAFGTGTDGRIVLWNRAAAKLLGYTSHEVLGRASRDLFSGSDDSGNRLSDPGSHVRRLVKRGERVQSLDMRIQTKAGRPVWINLNTLVIPGRPTGSLVGIHVFRNVTASRKLVSIAQERTLGPRGTEVPEHALTRRELEILRLISTGANTKAIAAQLHVSPATVRNHVQSMLRKLDAHSRLEAVAYAARNRLF